MRFRSPNHQRVFPFADEVNGVQHRSGIIGAFFEALTAKLVEGRRLSVDAPQGHNPDVLAANGCAYESKASARTRWLIESRQLEQGSAAFVLWAYAPVPPTVGTGTAVRAHCGATVSRAWILSAASVRALLEGTPHATPRYAASSWARHLAFYVVVQRYLREAEHDTPVERFHFHAGCVQGAPVRGCAITRFLFDVPGGGVGGAGQGAEAGDAGRAVLGGDREYPTGDGAAPDCSDPGDDPDARFPQGARGGWTEPGVVAGDERALAAARGSAPAVEVRAQAVADRAGGRAGAQWVGGPAGVRSGDPGTVGDGGRTP